MEKSALIEAGRIVNTHGVAGEVKIEVWLDGPQFLRRCGRVFLNGTERKILSSAQVTEKKWKELTADLAPWRGRTVWLYLIADVGPANSSDCDASAWGGLELRMKRR